MTTPGGTPNGSKARRPHLLGCRVHALGHSRQSQDKGNDKQELGNGCCCEERMDAVEATEI